MEVTVQTFQKVTLSNDTITEVTKAALFKKLDIGLSGRDYPYLEDGKLMKFEDWGSRGSDRVEMRKATELDIAILTVLAALK